MLTSNAIKGLVAKYSTPSVPQSYLGTVSITLSQYASVSLAKG